jgi:hypothetical protein
MVKVARLEIPKARSLEEDENGHHFADAQHRVVDSVLLPLGDLMDLEMWNELPTELVTVIEEAEHVHWVFLGEVRIFAEAQSTLRFSSLKGVPFSRSSPAARPWELRRTHVRIESLYHGKLSPWRSLMPSLPAEMIVLLAPFAQLFSERVWGHAQVLVARSDSSPQQMRKISFCLHFVRVLSCTPSTRPQ